MQPDGDVVIRLYRDADEPSWLECRLLGFFPTSYFDDVHTVKTRFERPAIELVAARPDGTVLGLLDVEVAGDLATVDCIVVRPGADRTGVATRLFDEALRRLPPEVACIDAWTREDPPANGWYLRHGFAVRTRYLHVYLDDGDPREGFAVPDGLSLPVKAFLHAPKRMERFVRERYGRVHECRRYVRAR